MRVSRDGAPKAPLAEVGPAPVWSGTDRQGSATGTEITFLPTHEPAKPRFDCHPGIGCARNPF